MLNAIDLRRIDLNLLVVFTAIYETRSVRQAAKRLFVGQSAVSMALARLRRVVGDPLFVRGIDGFEPTERAMALMPHITSALSTIGAALDAADPFEPARANRTIRLGLSDDIELWLLPKLLEVLGKHAPGVFTVVRGSNWYTGSDLVERGDADISIGVLPRPTGVLAGETLYEETFSALFDPRHVRPPLGLRRYLAIPHVMVSIAGDRVGVVDEALRKRGVTRKLVATLPGFATLPSVLRRRPLIANVPTTAASALALYTGLRSARIPVAVGRFPVRMLWHKRSVNDALLSWLRDELRALAKNRV